MQPLGRIHVQHLFRPLHAELTMLLASLEADDWERPTPCPAWRVRDVAAHLLDGDLRQLSTRRDGYLPPPPPERLDEYAQLVAFLNRLNAEWVTAARRLSPTLIAELLAWSGERVTALFEAQDPDGPALFPVAWAGETESRNWMDLAREYTERWLHQTHVRVAVGAPVLASAETFGPVLDAFVRSLPRAYAAVDAPEGTAVSVAITGEAGGDWGLVRGDGGWTLLAGTPPDPAARVRMDDDTAWRLFSRALRRPAADAHVAREGDPRLTEPALEALGVMA